MKILVGLSGGFDSATAARALIEDGHTVEGAILVMHNFSDTKGAEEVAAALGIPLHKIDCREEFSRTVISSFISEYKKARTPNPCVICNPLVKFKCLQLFAKENGFDKIATGHYAEALKVPGGYTLKRARDSAKDQTYMLYRLPDDILSMLLLPLSGKVKEELREAARIIDAPALDKPDSQEICFIPDGDYAAYIEERTGPSPEGDFVNAEGKTLGRHKGIIRYTVGQRKGLGISLGERVFVTAINPETTEITLDTAPALSTCIRLSDVILHPDCEITEKITFECEVKIRYAARPAAATVTVYPDMHATVVFREPQRSVTPGQSAVFYDGDILLGGGFID